MIDDRKITLYYAPNSRSQGTLILLDELGAPYDMHELDLNTGDQEKPEFRAINPMGKVPAIRHGEAVIAEQVAVFLYLADLFPEAGLAPAIGDPLRGPYLRWMVFYSSCFEPAMIDRAMKRDAAPQRTNPYGSFDLMLDALVGQLAKGPYVLGDRFSAADILWGRALLYMTQVKLLPESPIISAYVARIAARPSVVRAAARDAEIANAQAAAREAAAKH